ncbi:MAG TPA: iron-sulfur cluster assembly accessory protein [Candidatus Nanoarchaeia archaeon]|nr:iron-sulfur cluster assembly accessory protein [Candidatus Nanoarchaeia archaeon]
MKSQETITKDMTIGEVVNKHPESASIMLSYGLHCVGCAVNPFETIEMGAMGHGMDEKTVENLVSDINKAVKENEGVSTKVVTITENAAKKFKEFAKEENKENGFVRLTAFGGGCSGLQYSLDFIDNALETDEVFEEHGIKIVVDKGLVDHIKGTKIDFVENEKGSGFKIDQYAAKESCGTGCGCSE